MQQLFIYSFINSFMPILMNCISLNFAPLCAYWCVHFLCCLSIRSLQHSMSASGPLFAQPDSSAINCHEI